MEPRTKFPFETIYEDTRRVFSFRNGKEPTPDTFAYTAYWSEALRLLVIRRYFLGDHDEPYADDVTSFDGVWERGEAIRIAVKFADHSAEEQMLNAGKVGLDRLRTLDKELEEISGRSLLPWLHQTQGEAAPTPPNGSEDDGSSTLH